MSPSHTVGTTLSRGVGLLVLSSFHGGMRPGILSGYVLSSPQPRHISSVLSSSAHEGRERVGDMEGEREGE